MHLLKYQIRRKDGKWENQQQQQRKTKTNQLSIFHMNLFADNKLCITNLLLFVSDGGKYRTHNRIVYLPIRKKYTAKCMPILIYLVADVETWLTEMCASICISSSSMITSNKQIEYILKTTFCIEYSFFFFQEFEQFYSTFELQSLQMSASILRYVCIRKQVSNELLCL